MSISSLSQRLLAAHASKPNQVFYADEVLGGMFRDSDLEQLDKAYLDLAEAGLMEKAGATISYFGAPKSLYRITQKGEQEATPTAA